MIDYLKLWSEYSLEFVKQYPGLINNQQWVLWVLYNNISPYSEMYMLTLFHLDECILNLYQIMNLSVQIGPYLDEQIQENYV
jgi:hypothetical protein